MKKIIALLFVMLISSSAFAQVSWCRSTGQGIPCYRTILNSEISIVGDFLNKFDALNIAPEIKADFRNKVVSADTDIRAECSQRNPGEIDYAECYYVGLTQLRSSVVQGYNVTKKQLASK